MDLGEKDKYVMDNKNEDHMNYSTDVSSDWRFDAPNLTNTSTGLIQPGNSMAIGKCDLIGSSSCSSALIADSYVPTLWDHPTSLQNMGFCDIGAQNNVAALGAVGTRKGSPVATLRSGADRTLDMCWNPSSAMLKGGLFLPNMPGVIPQSLSQLPADSAFIERAARFSSFNGNFTDIMNPFAMPESMGLYSRSGGMVPGGPEVFAGNGLRQLASGMNCQRSEINASETSKDASGNAEARIAEGSPLKGQRRSESLAKSNDEEKQAVDGSENESDEAEFSSGVGIGQEEPSILECAAGEPSTKGISSSKRKRNGQDSNDQAKGTLHQPGELIKDNAEHQHKGDHNPSVNTNKNAAKNGKQGSQASDPTKEEYIHVRARRGQATNSHSLAERVRREKISERMKFLQDLVPGCNKVTGKAVMLDEIINYVQSLQRQVEFLSMKLATVNPRLDFNLEGLLAKDILQPRVVGSSSSLAFSSDMPIAYPPLQPPQQGLIQPGLPGMGSASEILRRTISSQMTPLPVGFKEPAQLPNVWEDELNNVVHMSFGTRTSPSSHDADGSLPGGQMKVEL